MLGVCTCLSPRTKSSEMDVSDRRQHVARRLASHNNHKKFISAILLYTAAASDGARISERPR